MRPLALAIMLTLFGSLPVWAQDPGTPPASESAKAERYALADGFAALHQILSFAESYLNEHLEVDGRYHLGKENDSSWGRMRFRLYPRGRSMPSESIAGDTWIKTQDGAWAFQFRLDEVPPLGLDPEQYL